MEATASWWRAERVARATTTTAGPRGSRIAFGAIVAFTVILILSPQVWFPVLKSLRIAFVAAGIAIAAQLLDHTVRRRAGGPAHPEIAIVSCLVGWAVLTVPLSYWPGGSITVLTEYFLKAVAFFWLIGTVITTSHRLRIFVWLLVLTSIPLSVTAIQNYQSGVFLQTPMGAAERIAGYNIGGSGLTANPNDLALMLNLLIPFAAALLMSERGLLQRLTAGAALLLSAVAVILTFSRAGFLTLVALGVVWLARTAIRRPLAALAAVLVLAMTPTVVPEGYLERLSTITDISADPTGSAQGRWSDLTVAAGLVAHNPLTGVGLGQNVLALNQQRGATWREVHNVYLQYAVDLGLPGLALFLWLFVALFRTAGRVRRRHATDYGSRDIGIIAGSVQAALIAFSVAAFFHPVAYQFYFFFVAGLGLAVQNVSWATRRSAPLARQSAGWAA